MRPIGRSGQSASRGPAARWRPQRERGHGGHHQLNCVAAFPASRDHSGHDPQDRGSILSMFRAAGDVLGSRTAAYLVEAGVVPRTPSIERPRAGARKALTRQFIAGDLSRERDRCFKLPVLWETRSPARGSQHEDRASLHPRRRGSHHRRLHRSRHRAAKLRPKPEAAGSEPARSPRGSASPLPRAPSSSTSPPRAQRTRPG